MPKCNVSVIIPCFRSSDMVVRAVQSVAEQVLVPHEVILVDDCSDDNTLDTLYHLQSIYPQGWIKIYSTSVNSGPGTARNVGWNAATQPFIAFLDSDDTWHSKKLEIQYEWMLSQPSVALTGHSSAFVRNTKIPRCGKLLYFSREFNIIKAEALLKKNYFCTSGIMLDSSLKYRFKEGKRYSEDYLLWCQICLDGHICCFSYDKLTCIHKRVFGENGLSSNILAMELGELDTLLSLSNEKLIKNSTFIFCTVLSLSKFFLRFLTVLCRRAFYSLK